MNCLILAPESDMAVSRGMASRFEAASLCCDLSPHGVLFALQELCSFLLQLLRTDHINLRLEEHQKWLRFKLLVNRVMEEREAAIEAAWHAFLADHRHAYGLSLKMQLSQEVTRQWHQCRETLVTMASPALPMHERRLRSVMDRAFLGIRKQAIRL